MRIGIIGSRGIPNYYGGFEQFVEFTAPILVEKGHDLYVYNSSLHPFRGKKWKGVNIIRKYDPENKIGTAGQFIYDLNCILDARKRRFDVILQLGYTSSSIWSFLFPKQSVIITNMDGLEWKRSKYSQLTKSFLIKAERLAVKKSHYLIADSKGIQEYLSKTYNKPSCFIPYGAQLVKAVSDEILIEKNLQKFGYNLLIARMEPENNIEIIIKGHLASGIRIPLIIIGSTKNTFGRYLQKNYSNEIIQFWGSLYDLETLNSLRFYSYLYFHGHSVGGTNPSLLEAMGSHSLIVAHDNIFNKAILESDAFYFSTLGDIQNLLRKNMERTSFTYMIEQNAEKIRHIYSWEKIINSLENLLIHATEKSTPERE